jgi:hypothetical protein
VVAFGVEVVVSVIYSAKQNGHSLFQEGQLWGKLGLGHLKLLWTGRSRMALVLPYKPRNTHLVRIEHGPEESTNGGEETFELVVFSSYEVVARAPYLGETRAWIGDATWKPLDRATVEVLMGGEVS